MTDPLDAARQYFDQGLNVVSMKQKKPLVEWARWQTQKQTVEELEDQPWVQADGFAVICGAKLESGLFLAAVDFDVKNVSAEAQAKGRQILKKLLITQMEATPSGGQHWLYHTHTKPKTVSVYHNDCGLELLGEGKLCIMAPTQGYKPLNDNAPSILLDIESELYEAMYKAGLPPKTQTVKTEAWFDRKDFSEKRFMGKTPPCIDALYRGAKEGERNEYVIRLASFLANFRRMRPDVVLEQVRKINRLYEVPLDDQELQGIVRSAVNGGYVYGCQDPFLSRFCQRDECPIAPSVSRTLSSEQVERAEKLQFEANLLGHVLSFGKRRLIGEDNALLSNFIMLASGRTKYPISGVVSGFSGSGKNESIRAIKPLIPKEWFFEFTTSTPEAMKYLPEEFTGTLIIYEALGVRGDSGSLSLRAIGEGESIETIYPMRNEQTGKMEMGRAKTNAKNFITTSSDIDINPDLYRRVLKHTMNHSTELTKLVMAKKLSDAALPYAIKNALGLQTALPFTEEDFQNALQLLDWSLEVVVFAPPELLKILDLAVKREQEVALRTHIEKIVNFTRVIALLNQKRRLRVDIGEVGCIVAEPEDFRKSLESLEASIMETVSRIEKRQDEALQLFVNPDTCLNKDEVAGKLHVSTRTASRLLKTLRQAGYLREEVQGKAKNYFLGQNKPESLDLLGKTRSFGVFHRNSLKTWLDAIWTTGHESGVPLTFKRYDPKLKQTVNLTSLEQLFSSEFPESTIDDKKAISTQETFELGREEKLEHNSPIVNSSGEQFAVDSSLDTLNDADSSQNPLSPPPTVICPEVHIASNQKSSLDCQNSQVHLAKSERSINEDSKAENSQKFQLYSLDDFAEVHWVEGGFGWHQCGVCSYTKLTCCQGETFKKETVWLCEDCQSDWEKGGKIEHN